MSNALYNFNSWVNAVAAGMGISVELANSSAQTFRNLYDAIVAKQEMDAAAAQQARDIATVQAAQQVTAQAAQVVQQQIAQQAVQPATAPAVQTDATPAFDWQAWTDATRARLAQEKAAADASYTQNMTLQLQVEQARQANVVGKMGRVLTVVDAPNADNAPLETEFANALAGVDVREIPRWQARELFRK